MGKTVKAKPDSEKTVGERPVKKSGKIPAANYPVRKKKS